MEIEADISLYADNFKRSVLGENNKEWQKTPAFPSFVYMLTPSLAKT